MIVAPLGPSCTLETCARVASWTGVVTVHGMIDSLGTNKYDVIGPLSFENSCKYGDILAGWGDNCAMGNGWCEYAGNVSGFVGADWVAQNKQSLMLMSHASCSPSAFGGQTDGALPLDAQGSPLAVGMAMTVAPDGTWRPGHGILYGSFCHSDITNANNAGHMASVESARDHILEWVFTRARRVADAGVIDVDALGYQSATPEFADIEAVRRDAENKGFGEVALRARMVWVEQARMAGSEVGTELANLIDRADKHGFARLAAQARAWQRTSKHAHAAP